MTQISPKTTVCNVNMHSYNKETFWLRPYKASDDKTGPIFVSLMYDLSWHAYLLILSIRVGFRVDIDIGNFLRIQLAIACKIQDVSLLTKKYILHTCFIFKICIFNKILLPFQSAEIPFENIWNHKIIASFLNPVFLNGPLF